MTRKYPVINNKYVVDKEAKIQIGDKVYPKEFTGECFFWKNLLLTFPTVTYIKYTDKGSGDNGKSRLLVLGGKNKGTFGEPEVVGNVFYENYFWKLVSIIGEENRIQGLPVIVFEKPIDITVPYDIPNTHEEAGNYIRGYADGFRASTSKGCWTDEDIDGFMLYLNSYLFVATDKEIGEPVNDGMLNDARKSYFDKLKQPQEIKEIELEVEGGEYYSYISESDGVSVTESGGFKPIKLKTTTSDKGNVIIIQKP